MPLKQRNRNHGEVLDTLEVVTDMDCWEASLVDTDIHLLPPYRHHLTLRVTPFHQYRITEILLAVSVVVDHQLQNSLRWTLSIPTGGKHGEKI